MIVGASSLNTDLSKTSAPRMEGAEARPSRKTLLGDWCMVRRPPLPRPVLGPSARGLHLGQPKRQFSGGLRSIRGVFCQTGQHEVIECRGNRQVCPG